MGRCSRKGHARQFDVTQCSEAQQSTQRNTIHNTIEHSTAQHSTAQLNIVLHRTTRHHNTSRLCGRLFAKQPTRAQCREPNIKASTSTTPEPPGCVNTSSPLNCNSCTAILRAPLVGFWRPRQLLRPPAAAAPVVGTSAAAPPTSASLRGRAKRGGLCHGVQRVRILTCAAPSALQELRSTYLLCTACCALSSTRTVHGLRSLLRLKHIRTVCSR